MKKYLSIFVVLMIMSSVVLAGGTENPLLPTNMAILKTAIGARVIYKTEKPSVVKISIYSRDKEIFSENVKINSSFTRQYDLSNLPQGEYVLVMEDDNGKREEKFSTVKKVEVLSSIIHAKNLKKFAVTLYSQDNAQIRIRLTDQDKNVLAFEYYTVNGQASKLFNLENVQGPVFVEVIGTNGLIQSSLIQ